VVASFPSVIFSLTTALILAFLLPFCAQMYRKQAVVIYSTTTHISYQCSHRSGRQMCNRAACSPRRRTRRDIGAFPLELPQTLLRLTGSRDGGPTKQTGWLRKGPILSPSRSGYQQMEAPRVHGVATGRLRV
jgi:hypothetical protein